MALIAGLAFMLLTESSWAAPHEAEEFSLRQPDGPLVPVLVWGDEFHQDVESPDGYSLIRDENGWICYAVLSSDGSEYISSGIRYTGESRSRSFKKHLRINKESIRRKQRRNKVVLGYEELISPPSSGSSEFSPAPPEDGIQPADPRTVVGLTLLIDFPDQKSSFTQANIEAFCNQQGYNAGNVNGSVYDYFNDVSNGLMNYTNIVTPFVTVDSNKTYYDRGPGYGYVQELITNALNKLKNSGFDLSRVTTSNNRVVALNIYYAGTAEAGWSNGLWPHAGSYRGGVTINGIGFSRYQMSSLGSSLRLGTFVHENGHMLMGWADLYSYDGHSNGVGRWCVMNTINPATNPQQPNAYFRSLAGWIDVTDITGRPRGTAYSHKANSHSAYTYTRNSKEFYFIEARRRTGRSAGLPGEGLAIWHVHKDGDNTSPDKGFPLVALIQADGRKDLENKTNSGDSYDLYRSNYNARFNSTTLPAAVYHDGITSGIDIAQISAAGDVMTFTIGDNAAIVTYTLTVENGSGSGTYAPGDTVNISAPKSSTNGFFLRWSSTALSAENPYSTQTIVIMGNSDATVTANFAAPVAIPGTIQAENYGVQANTTIGTSYDVSGGQYTRFNATGAYLEFLIEAETEGACRFSYRVASTSSSAVLRLRDMITNTVLDSFTLPATGGNRIWTTVVGNSVPVAAGRSVWRVESANGVYNLNWFNAEAVFPLTVVNGFGSGTYPAGQTVAIDAPAVDDNKLFLRWSSESVAVSNAYSRQTNLVTGASEATVTAHFCNLINLPDTIEAEQFGYAQGAANTDVGNNQAVRFGSAGEFTEYLIELHSGSTYSLSFRLASMATDAKLVLRDLTNNLVLDTIIIPQTGSLQDWQTVSSYPVQIASDTAVWRLELLEGSCSLDWFMVNTTGSLQVVNGSGSGVYPSGTVVEIRADAPPEPYKLFAGWTGSEASLSAVLDPSSSETSVTTGNVPILLTATYIDSPTVGIVMPSGTGHRVTVSDTLFYDDGGRYSAYSNNFSGEITLIPASEWSVVALNFELIDVSESVVNGYRDSLLVYSGSGETKHLLGMFSGKTLPQQIISDDPEGELTVRFVSGSGLTAAGWKIHVTTAEVVASSIARRALPTSFGLGIGQNGTISYQLPKGENTKVALYDMRGRMISILFEGYRMPGFYSINLSGRTFSIGQGFYIVRMTSGSYTKSVNCFLRR